MNDYKKIYCNIHTKEKETIQKTNMKWTGPRLLTLCAVTLIISIGLIWLMASNMIGPTIYP